MAYLRSGIDGGARNSLVRNRVIDIRGDLATGGRLVLSTLSQLLLMVMNWAE